MNDTNTAKMMTREQAAEYIGVKPQTLAMWLSTKRYSIPVIKVGRLVRYRRSDLDAWLLARTVGVCPAAAGA